jgi:hypothetical protein
MNAFDHRTAAASRLVCGRYARSGDAWPAPFTGFFN